MKNVLVRMIGSPDCMAGAQNEINIIDLALPF